MASTSIQAKLYAVRYEYVVDALEKRKPYRQDHLSLINKESEKGNVILAGATGNPPTGGLLIFRNLSSDEIEKVIKKDPYVVNGVVTKYTIEPYLAVVGDSVLANDLIKI